MNDKGQMASVGMILTLFVGIVVAMALLSGAIFPAVGSMTNTVTYNKTVAAVVNGTPTYLTDIKVLTSPVIYNATGGLVLGSGNYTITNNVVYNGQEAVRIDPSAPAALQNAWIVTGTGQPLTYDANSGGRTMVGLIAIFAALAVGVFAISPTLREKLFDMF